MRSTAFVPGVCLLLAVFHVSAAEPRITWPPGWQIETLPTTSGAQAQGMQVRQRAVKNDQAGNQIMVMELTQTPLAAGHQVNVQGVLLEMRKAVQVNFARSGLQSACTHVKETQLGRVAALETTCTVTQNGVHVLSQTLVAAAGTSTAWSLSYAGSAQAYAASREEVLRIRQSLELEDAAP